MLNDLLRDVPSEPTKPTGLGGLVRGSAGQRMTLVEAMNALERGEVPRPPDGALGELMNPLADLPARPAPPPKRYVEQDIVDAARAQHAQDVAAMREVIRAKQRAVETSAMLTKDPATAMQDSARRHQVTRRLDAAARELENDYGR